MPFNINRGIFFLSSAINYKSKKNYNYMKIIHSNIPSAKACGVSLLLWRNFPKAWNRVIFSSLPHGNEIWGLMCPSPELALDNKLGLPDFSSSWVSFGTDSWTGNDLTIFMQQYCKEVMACLMSPPLTLAIWSIHCAGTSHFSSWHILVRVFLMEFSVIGLKPTCDIIVIGYH